MAGEDMVPIQITGEVPVEKLEELVVYLGRAGIMVKSGGELEMLSPSILIEYLEGVNGLPVPAVTQETLEEFLLAEGAHERGTKTNAHQFMRVLELHTMRHDMGGGLNHWGRAASGCDCPLRSVQYRSQWGEAFVGGLDPESIIAFSELSYEEAKQTVNPFNPQFAQLGQGRYKLAQKIADRLREDTDI